MSDLANKLNAFKKIQSNDGKPSPNSARTSRPKNSFVASSPEALEEMYNAPYQPDAKTDSQLAQEQLTGTLRSVYNGEMSEEQKEMLQERISKSKMNSSILESILNNPLIDPTINKSADDLENDAVGQFAKRVGLKQTSNRVNESIAITEKLNNMDKAKTQTRVNENVSNVMGTIDYNKIAEIVDTIVESKLANAGMLNESVNNHNFNGLKAIKIVNDGKFLVLDNDDNIFECVMSYKGKNKASKKK